MIFIGGIMLMIAVWPPRLFPVAHIRFSCSKCTYPDGEESGRNAHINVTCPPPVFPTTAYSVYELR